MKHLFAPYELALKAKEAGFDEECFGIYTWNFGVPTSPIYKLEDNKITGGECIPNYSSFEFAFDSIFRRELVSNSQMAHIKLSDGNPQNIAAPLYQQLIDWFREKHKIHIYLYLNAGKDAYNISLDYTYFTKENDEIVNANLMMGYEYDKAVHVALDEAFILIKK